MNLFPNFSNWPKEKLPLVLLTGWGFKSSIWDSLIKLLSPYFSIIKIEWPLLNPDQDWQSHLDMLRNYLFYKIPDGAILMGWSLGGLVAYDFCFHYAKKVSALITLAASPQFIADEEIPGISLKNFNILKKLYTKNFEEFLVYFLKLLTYPNLNSLQVKEIKHHFDSVNKASVLCYLEILKNLSLKKHLCDLTLPILNLYGEKDAIVPMSSALYLKKHNFFEQNIYKELGHLLFWQSPELCFKAIAQFVEEKILNENIST